jgi:regulator of RNase E activity RraB
MAGAPGTNRTANAPDVDQQVLDQLQAAGSDLSKPHPLEFYLYFPAEDLAHKVADEIEADGYKVEVKRAPRGGTWMCYVTRRMAPKRAEIAAMGKRFRELAQKYGGEYDGWETEVVR